MTKETSFNYPHIDVIEEKCFLADSHLAHEYVKDLGNGHKIHELPDKLALVYTEDVPVGSLPLHVGSWANYCLDMTDGLDRVLVWHINPSPDGPPLTTSEHYHPADGDEPDKPGIDELYTIGRGLLDLDVGQNPDNKTTNRMEGDLKDPDTYTVLQRDWHQGKTVKGPVTVMIRMFNAAHWPLDKQHIRR